jgi:hypothetical protein
MTLTLLRVYPACSSLATACSMTLSHIACISFASCSCHLIIEGKRSLGGSELCGGKGRRGGAYPGFG